MNSTALQQPDLSTLLQENGVKFDFAGGRKGKFISTGATDRPITDFLNFVFLYAANIKASDVHFSDVENGCAVRLRHRNMKLKRHWLFTRDAAENIRRKICAMCNVAVTDSESIQQGSFFVLDEVAQKMIDIRVDMIPTKFGFNIVCRILDQSNSGRDLDTVYMPPDVRDAVLETLNKPQGMVIVSGPTGSGKTSTLYSFLNYLNTDDRHIITAEDPVEYRLPGANQVNIHRNFRTFGEVLRSFLRQDPDIILVGEIRDTETAETAATAANTGHLLLSTIHANDALSTVIRLTQLGVERFALADALTTFFAQRLLNRLCGHCKKECRLPETEQGKTRFVADKYFVKGDGCEKCQHTGLSGRIPVMEFAVNTKEVRQAILTHDFALLEQAMLAQPQYKTLIEAGLLMSEQGLVDMQEALSLGVR
ncbi:MAG: Flp pilus assembly complex ATPase component TadA [Neisseriaceae bacterium]|nr:Flp pilus assembly complex ATPase component TadA [Neisseriaceae bacterium]